MKKLASVLLAGLLLVAMSGTAALAGDDNGQKIGQDAVRKVLTQCSNAGTGNGQELEAGFLGIFSVKSDCLEKKLFEPYGLEEGLAILAQAGCTVEDYVFVVCEVDPGNSAAHNQSPEGVAVED